MALSRSCAVVLLLALLASPAFGYYLPGSFPNEYYANDTLAVKVNSVTSTNTELPFGYYTLPFCKPPGGVKNMAENLGELIMGDRIQNSPYQFRMLQEEFSVKLCDVIKLTQKDVKDLQIKISENYMVNMILDNLPITTDNLNKTKGELLLGFPLGIVASKGNYVLHNHLSFTVLVHEQTPVTLPYDAAPTRPDKTYMVVGFEVEYCSVAWGDTSETKSLGYLERFSCGDKPAQRVAVDEEVTYTYDIKWERSDVKWVSRWDAYLKMEGDQVHWFSILNSVMVVCFLSGVVLIILLRTVRRDLSQYEELVTDKSEDIKEDSGWKLVSGDVFRAPPSAARLCYFVGSGLQVMGMAVVTIFFAALGFMSPAARGHLLTTVVVLYLLLGIFAGYCAVYLWSIISGKPESWRSVAWQVATFLPGISFVILAIINIAIKFTGSSGAMPFFAFFGLFLLWFVISVPLTLIGGYSASRKVTPDYPVRTNQIPRQIPPQAAHPMLLTLGAGVLPFGTLFIELYFIMSSLWLHRVYYAFGFLLVVIFLLVLVCAEVSVVLTYVQLCAEDYRWWWRSFLASGSVALYTLLYAGGYLFFDLQNLMGPVPVIAIMYMGYMVIIVLALFLAAGSVGFLSSFYFVWRIFASVKAD
eukprot:jgi/Chlat1/4440/Chrsp29S04396